jgi:uncharacterized protein involved in exopolysaccharide biosynthesis
MKEIIEQRLERRRAERDELGEAYNILVQQTNDVEQRLRKSIAAVEELGELMQEVAPEQPEEEEACG